MSVPRITLCADGHYRRVIYGLSPYIADYPEQCLLACMVNNWCARCFFFSAGKRSTNTELLSWEDVLQIPRG